MIAIDDRAAEALTRSFLLGTGRQPLPAGALPQSFLSAKAAPPELTALALIGQRLRYRRHGAPPKSDKPTPIEDRRQIVPDAARPLMRRLVASKGGSATDVAALALADLCDRLGLRPHPFDLPRLGAFVKAHGESLGTQALAFAARGEAEGQRASDYFAADRIDAENWATARPAARAAFIAALRKSEPERARVLVETSFPNDPAPIRARLLEALARGLSPADAPFLESLDKDRAPSVREAAQRLIRLIPGGASAAARLRELVERIKISSSGLFRKRVKLSLELPANLQGAVPAMPTAEAGRRFATEQYAGVGLDAMAGAFNLDVAGLMAAAADDTPLLALIARQAAIEQRFDVLASLTREHAADAWIDAIGTGVAAAELPDDAGVDRWCAAAIAPDLWPALPPAADLERLYGFLRRPLPRPQAHELLHSRAFAAIAPANAPQGHVGRLLIAVAALTPTALRVELRDALVALPPEETARALLLLDCLIRLDPPP
jgi:hypothetical protein